MTVSSTSTKDSFALTGAGTNFTFTSKIFDEDDLVVIRRDTAGVETILDLITDYTIAGTSWPTGGTITTVTNYTDGTLIIKAVLPKTQAYDYITAGSFPADSHEFNLDRAVLLIQELHEIVDRIPQLAETSSFSGLTMPDPVANYLVGFNSGATDLEAKLITDASTTVISAFMATLLDDSTALEARGTLDAAALTVANVFTNTQTWMKGADIASAASLLVNISGNEHDVTGTTGITSLEAVGIGTIKTLRFDGIVTITHDATNLDLGGSNITTEAGGIGVFYEYAAGDWRLMSYRRNGGILPADLSVSQFGGEYIKLSDVKSSGTDGGTFTLGAWRTRVLNTEDSDTGGNCTLSSNQFTLDAGTYIISATAPCYLVAQNKLKLYNISDSSDVLLGDNTYADISNNGGAKAKVSGRFTISSSKIFELQHLGVVTRSTNGFGVAATFGVSEIYSLVELWKVA